MWYRSFMAIARYHRSPEISQAVEYTSQALLDAFQVDEVRKSAAQLRLTLKEYSDTGFPSLYTDPRIQLAHEAVINSAFAQLGPDLAGEYQQAERLLTAGWMVLKFASHDIESGLVCRAVSDIVQALQRREVSAYSSLLLALEAVTSPRADREMHDLVASWHDFILMQNPDLVIPQNS